MHCHGLRRMDNLQGEAFSAVPSDLLADCALIPHQDHLNIGGPDRLHCTCHYAGRGIIASHCVQCNLDQSYEASFTAITSRPL